MTQPRIDPSSRLRYADDVLSQATNQIEALLREAAGQLRPFPPFPGAFFTFAVEVEPDGVQDRSVGCVVVSEEGELKELQISLDAEDPAFGSPDPISMRDEQLVDLDLSAFDRFLFAYRGLQTVTELLAQAGPDDQNRDPSSRA
jgi:hypothetical protein